MNSSLTHPHRPRHLLGKILGSVATVLLAVTGALMPVTAHAATTVGLQGTWTNSDTAPASFTCS